MLRLLSVVLILLPALLQPSSVAAATAPAKMLKVIATDPKYTSYTTSPTPVVAGDYAYFPASTVEQGTELWKTDGSVGNASLVADLMPGPASSNPNSLGSIGSTFFFSATSPAIGNELWATDGTTAGTRLILDIQPGIGSSNPSGFAVAGSVAYFSADDGTHGRELWVTDGTVAGTRLVADVTPGAAGSTITEITVVGTSIYFAVGTSPLCQY